MSFHLLNIGCNEVGKKGMINIDDGSYHESTDEFLSAYKQVTPADRNGERPLLIVCDAEQLPFKDKSFNHVNSDYCLGMYVIEYDDLIRTCKNKCAFTVTLFIDGIGGLVQGLMKRDVNIVHINRNRHDHDEASISGKLFKENI